MTDDQMDKALEEASGSAPPLDPALLARITGSLQGSLAPVRPLPPTWVLSAALALVCAVVATTAATGAGLHGWGLLRPGERWVIFATLGLLAWVAGTQFATQLIPASRQRLGGGAFLSGTCAVLLALFGLVFRDYHTEHFVTAGLVCLGLGVLVAIPAALLSFLVLRRGFAVDPVMAGLMGGALAGLSGVTLLELHCDNFQALHVLVWHTAVIPVSAAAGALVGRVLRGA